MSDIDSRAHAYANEVWEACVEREGEGFAWIHSRVAFADYRTVAIIVAHLSSRHGDWQSHMWFAERVVSSLSTCAPHLVVSPDRTSAIVAVRLLRSEAEAADADDDRLVRAILALTQGQPDG